MPDALQSVLTYIAIPVVVIIAGGSAAVFYSASPRVRSSLQHFAAGLVFAAVSTGLLPEIVRGHNLLGVITGFLLGIVVMVGMKWVTRASASRNQSSLKSLVFSAGMDYVVDGVLIGIGFVLGAKAGGLLIFALSVEGLFLALAVTSALSRKDIRCWKIIALAIVFGLLLALGAIAGAAMFGGLSGFVHTAVLAFGSAALIYLVIEELLVEAHDQHAPEDPITVGVFFAGFLLLLTVEMSV